MANVALPIPQMEVEKPPLGPEPPTLLKTYKWRTAAPMGDREPERGTGSPGSRRWTRLQGWKRSYSQPESDSPDDGAGKGSSGLGAPKASTRRSLFQRAFSAPSKGTKETRGPEGGKATLQKYLRSMSKRKGHVESGARAEQVPHDAVPGMGVMGRVGVRVLVLGDSDGIGAVVVGEELGVMGWGMMGGRWLLVMGWERWVGGDNDG